MPIYYSILLQFTLIDFYKLQILGYNPTLLFFVFLVALFLVSYFLLQPIIVLLVNYYTINLLSFIISSLLLLIVSLILLQMPDRLPETLVNQGESLFKYTLWLIGGLGLLIAFIYYMKHILKFK